MPACGTGNAATNELACLNRVVAEMERTMPKGKSQRYPQQQRNYRGGKGSGKGARGHADDTPCGCCGKTGHLKSECHQLGKDCNLCGKTGHMSQVCRCPVQHVKQQQGQQRQQQPQPKGQANAQTADKANFATVVKQQEDPWVCPICYATNYDPKKC